MDYKKILDYLYGMESPKIKLGLGRVQNLLGGIGNPEKNLKCIHVAGTNGKGSVCAIIFYILREAGYKVGMYTSPHLKKFNERIRVDNHFITDKEIVDYFLKVKPYITNQSFFEITTAMAFLYFKENNVDYAVLEVGLGGRLDATNVVTPLISVITNIGLEHTDLLGNTVEKIAFEKAGIIKQNVPVITGVKGNALKVIKKIAKQRKAPLTIPKQFGYVNFKNLNGTFQQENKDIALTTIEILIKNNLIKLNETQIQNGIKKTEWPGRMDFIEKNVLIDGAHNPDGFKVLKKELLIFEETRKIQNFIFVVGAQSTKDINEMLKIINPLVSSIIFTKSDNPKASKPQELLRIFNKINCNKKSKAKIINNPKNALDYARKIIKKNELIVATGSIYMIGEVI
ncbi:MAG TPA: folylpolyglutamate synthase/dihydrofolate synthase family protein [Candidatus Nanoarchaeia archaeon]|nr:folylpolyglutamate synthase/dihydrofolate synthase family protein [Candidatus Nanoarchaeia archaeon]